MQIDVKVWSNLYGEISAKMGKIAPRLSLVANVSDPSIVLLFDTDLGFNFFSDGMFYPYLWLGAVIYFHYI